jgi:hypothetical protein
MNGSGYMANHHLRWDANGSAEFDGSITAASGEIAGFTINSNYLGTNMTGYGTGLYSDGGIYSYPNPNNLPDRWSLNIWGKSQIMMKIGNFNIPVLLIGEETGIGSFSGGLNVYGRTENSQNNLYVLLGKTVTGAINSCEVKIEGTSLLYSYNGTDWFQFGRKPSRSTNGTNITLKNVDETIFVTGNITIPDGTYIGQHLTLVRKSSTQPRVTGKINNTSSTTWFDIGDNHQIIEMYWDGDIWATCFQNVVNS